MKIFAKEMILLLALLTLLPIASAEIIVGQVDSVYNVGDQFDLTTTVISSQATTDFFIASLICEGQDSVEIYRLPLDLAANEEKEIIISTKLGKFLVGSKEGTCRIRNTFGDEDASSHTFELTKDIVTKLRIQGSTFEPNDELFITGEAAKSKASPLNGFAQLKIEGLGFDLITPVTEGTFNANLTLPDDAKAGDYVVKVRTYEEDSSGDVINEGQEEARIIIRQVMREIGIALDSQSIRPDNELEYTVILYDQAEEHIEAEVPVIIFRPNGEEFEKSLVKTDESNSLAIQSNYEPGNWVIEAEINELKSTKEFTVEEYRKVSFYLENNTLFITNVGNVPYTGPVEVSIDNENEVKQIEELAVGETVIYRLRAPDGTYEIGASTGDIKENLGTAVLTGKAISVDELNDALGGRLILLVWLLVILLIAALAVSIYRKLRKKKENLGAMPASMPRTENALGQFESTNNDIISKGEKQESAVIALRINNSEILERANSEALKALDSALWKVKEEGSKIYSDENFRVMVLTPMISKTKDIPLKAIRVAKSLERMLSAHNKRHPQKIEFGIGANIGDLIVERKDGRFRFMSVDRTIAIAKKASQDSEENVLLTEGLRRRVAGKAKGRKMPNSTLWKLEKVTDRSEHSEYVNKFNKR